MQSIDENYLEELSVSARQCAALYTQRKAFAFVVQIPCSRGCWCALTPTGSKHHAVMQALDLNTRVIGSRFREQLQGAGRM